ncbi:MAG: hypothetical protein ACFB51_07585 [Anaerolineae bacterium]
MNRILNMMRYEIRIHWRRRGLRVMIISYALIMLVAIVQTISAVGLSELIAAGGLSSIEGTTGTEWMLLVTWTLTSGPLAFLMPLGLADAIPYDKQVGMSELLKSLPMSYPQYLLGKSFGATGALCLGVIGVLLIFAVPWWFIAGSYDVSVFLAMTLLAVPALAVINTMLVVLAAAGQPSAFRGLLIGIGLLIVLPVVIRLSHDNLIAFLLPSRGPMLSLYGPSINTGYMLFGHPVEGATAYIANVIIGLIEITAVFGIVVGWRQIKENNT